MGSHDHPDEEGRIAPRRLTGREAAILSHVLSAPDRRLDPLRGQARAARVVGRCMCGCATIDLAVDRTSSRPAALPTRTPVSADRRPPYDDDHWSVVLFTEDGWLASLEIIWYGRHRVEFPNVSELGPPTVDF